MRKTALVASVLFAFSPLCLAAPIYKWVDAQGVTHFDAQPPSGQPATQVKPTGGTAPPPPPASLPKAAPVGDQQAADEKVRKQLAEQEIKRKEYCDTARTNLAQLQNNARVREQINGEVRRLSEEERQTRLIETRRAIADECS